MAECTEGGEAVISSEEDLNRRPLATKEFPPEEPKESEAHIKTIEIPLNLLLPFMSSDEYFSSEEDKDIAEEQVAQYLGAIMKLNAKLFGNETWEDEPPLLINELNDLVQLKLPQKK